MKRFNDCFEAFIEYIKEKKGCPDIVTYQFSFEYQDKQDDNEQVFDIKEAEKKLNHFLDSGHSWINIVCKKIIDGCLFVTFEISEANSSEWVGRTTVNFSGPYVDINKNFLWTGLNKIT
jgi:hypothetical protein